MNIEIEGFEEMLAELLAMPRKANVSTARLLNFVAQSTAQRARARIRGGSRSGRVYTHTGTPHQASAPGEPPASLSGALAASIRSTRITDNITSGASVGSDLAYAAVLELGGYADGDFGVVYVDARPFLLPSFEEAVAAASGKFLEEFEKEFR